MRKFVYEIKIIIEPDGYGYYAYCPGLDGVFAGGDTKEEAFENAKNGATGILRTKLNLGDDIKEGPNLKRILPSSRHKKNSLSGYRTGTAILDCSYA